MAPGIEKYELNNTQPAKDYGSLHGATGQTRNFSSTENIVNEDDYDDQGIYLGNLSPDRDTRFRDGKRKIDYVLVYEELKNPSKKEKAHNAKLERWRQKYMTNLRKLGLDMEEEVVTSEKKTTYFIKLCTPWNVLVDYAEDMSMRAPLQEHQNPTENWSDRILQFVRIPNVMNQAVPNQPPDFYTCTFKKSKIHRFLGSENQDEYFTTSQRIRITHELLQKTVYGKRRRAEIGIDRLIEEKVYTAAYALHDGEFRIPPFKFIPESLNKRQVLFQYWARWGQWHKYQPLDHIREYFGEKIGIYFAWLGFYTGWLLPAAIVGFLVFLYGIFTMKGDIPSSEVCDSGEALKMCPLCQENIGCPYWYLSSTCLYAKVSYLFDHPGTVFYAIFVSFWAVTFLEYWKRKNASLAHHWDCLDFEEEEERPRPDFAAKAPLVERNPITGIKEPAFPFTLRLKRMAAGIGVIFLMMTLVMIFIVAVIVYRVLVSIPLFQNKLLSPRAVVIASTSGAIVNLILIMALGKVYEMLAYKLTEWEMHRTQTDFDDNLIFKVFLFQFVNFYSSIFYIAFFKGKFVGYPGHYSRILGLRNEDCANGGCLMELAQQLAVIMIGKQIINNVQEVVVPKLKTWWHQKNVKLSENINRWQSDYNLIEHEGLFEEYLEMVLQFGFITIFVAAFPLAPLFALLNNWVEIRLDAQKIVCETRRIVPERAQDIGVWFRILETLAHLAVISNAFLIAFTSDFLPKLLYQYEFNSDLNGYINFTLAFSPNGTMTEECRYRGYRDSDGHTTKFYWRLLAIRLGFVIVFEHVVFSICKLIDWLVPDIPESLEIKIKREHYLAKQALADADFHTQIDYDDDDPLSPKA